MRRDTEITAGVPGLGLSGLFVLLSALALPLAGRRGQQHAPRARIGGLFAMAVIMTAAIILTWEAIIVAVTALHAAGHGRSVTSAALAGHGFWRLPVIAISASIMVLLIAAAEALLHLVGSKPTPTPPPITSALPTHVSPGESEPTLRFVIKAKPARSAHRHRPSRGRRL